MISLFSCIKKDAYFIKFFKKNSNGKNMNVIDNNNPASINKKEENFENFQIHLY